MLKNTVEENKEVYSRMDSDTRQLLEVVGRVRIREDDRVMENEEKTYDLCKAFADMALAAQQQVGSYDVEQIYKVYSAGGC